MDGIDGTLLPVVCEMLGIEDPETLFCQLVAIREHQKPKE